MISSKFNFEPQSDITMFTVVSEQALIESEDYEKNSHYSVSACSNFNFRSLKGCSCCIF